MNRKTRNISVAIINYGMGNIFSVENALSYLKVQSIAITSNPADIAQADLVILPGVGAFGEAMANLRRLDLVSPLRDVVLSGKPLFGICLGMQLLMSESEEFGSHEGLNIISGQVASLKPFTEHGILYKVPHIGWHSIQLAGERSKNECLFEGMTSGEYVYFVHSYYVSPEQESVVMSTTSYGEMSFCSSLRSGNVIATQFHPERSGAIGLRMYDNLISMCEEIKIALE